MWCPHCQADVAAELSADERRLLCARCGTETGLAAASVISPSGPRLSKEMARDASDLLARWAAEGLQESRSSAGLSSGNRTKPAPIKIADHVAAEPVADAHQPAVDAGPIMHNPPQRRRSSVDPLSSWVAVGGQMAAYVGVLLLTCGTALVVRSQFSGTMQQAITGWLLTTVGQMLLFVGVVTLVSHGLEQSRRDIARQMKRFRRILQRHSTEANCESDRRAA